MPRKKRPYIISASNACGRSINYSVTVAEDNSNPCRTVPEIPRFTLPPNPSSSNDITISQNISEISAAKNEEFTLILYNKLQVKVCETPLNTLSKTISTENLSNDVYFLHIIDKDGNKVVKQVMILR